MSNTGVEFGLGAWEPGTPQLASFSNIEKGGVIYLADSQGKRYFEMVDEFGVATGYDVDTLHTDIDMGCLTSGEKIDFLSGGMGYLPARELCELGLVDLVLDHKAAGTLDELAEILGIRSIEDIEGPEICKILFETKNIPREIERVRTYG